MSAEARERGQRAGDAATGPRPYVVASCAVSVDGATDDPRGPRLLLSGPEDFDRVDELRAGCDAILVGAGTVRRDDPRLLVRSPGRRAARAERGLPPSPVRVVLAAGGDLDPSAAVFAVGGAPTRVYCADPAAGLARARLGRAATVLAAGDPPDVAVALADLAALGMRRLLVEGGQRVHTAFLAAGLVDELHLAVAPLFVGAADSPRFVGPAAFPHSAANRMTLADVRAVGDVAVARYLLDRADEPGQADGADRRWLRFAIELSRSCPPSATAFSVGAAVVGADGRLLATGFSRELDRHDHAEEVALRRVPVGADLAGATVYSSLEPCSARASRPRTCSELIEAAGVGRVVFAWREPELFVDCHGAENLRAAGLDVVELPDLAPAVRDINSHLR